jgi:hypothetical protein
MKTRKPVVKLTVTDFRAYPIWEFATDEEAEAGLDETWVRPVSAKYVRKGEYSQIVSCEFWTARGRKLRGFMIVTTATRDVEIMPGAIIGGVGYLPLPARTDDTAKLKEETWLMRERERFLKALDESEGDIFPMKFGLTVQVLGESKFRNGELF